MNSDQVEHTSFTIERDLPGSPRHAFRFWSDPKLKDRWNGCHDDWEILDEAFDFRVGGGERRHWRTPEGQDLILRSYYLDIEQDRRIIYAYEMSFGGKRLSASLVTIELTADGPGTQLKVTEQAAFMGGGSEERIQGTNEGFDRLVEVVGQELSNAA